MTTVFAGLPLKRSFLALVYLISLSTLVTGCQISNPGSNKSTVQIAVWDDQTLRPVDRAEVFLRLPEQVYPVEYTDTVGRAIFEVNKEFLNGVSEVIIQKDGYQTQTHNLMLSNAPLFQTYLVPVGATAVPRETPSVTPVPPTSRPEDTVTPLATETIVPTNTAIPTTKPTNTPRPTSPTDTITLTRREGAETVFVLAGPDVSNVQLGTLAVNETAEVIGRTGQSEWLLIITDRGVQGWVANCEVTLSSSDLSSVTITWTGLVTPKNCGDTD
jgi:hypothetical protein